ncbi:MAG: DUF4381 family protein [Akkermansiaceae bacterium]|nr:DUF4381 family protein [Akkermansiaceae bacterium]
MEENENSFELVESRDAIDLMPGWEPQVWWYCAAAGVVLGVVLLVMFLRRKKTASDPGKERREAYLEAKGDFEKGAGSSAREAAVRVSVILRRYLSKSMREPALFETHEEFVSRHDALKGLPEDVRQSLGVFFAKLAELKYAPDVAEGAASEFYSGGLELLERIHTQ